MKLKLTGLFIVLMLINTAVFAQQKLELSVQQAVDHALKYNKTMMNSGLAVDKAQQGLREAIANGLPQVNATVDYTNALGADISIQFSEDMPATKIPIEPTSNFNLQVTQLIFNGGYIVGVQTAKLYKELSQLNLKKSETEIRTQVTSRYYLVLVSQELNKKLQQNLANLKDLYKKTEPLAAVGIKEKNDIDQLLVQVNSVQNAVNASERQLELATNMLRLQLGTDINTELVLSDELESILNQETAETPLTQSFSLENNLDFRMMDQQVGISRKMVDLKKSAALPSIAGYYSYTYKIMKPNFDMSPPNVLGLQMNIPVFSSGLRSAQTKQAFIDLKTMQNQRDLVSDQLRMQEKQLRYNYINAMETFTNQKSNIEVSRRIYSSLKLKYEQGMISGLDLISADNNYVQAETSYISSALQMLEARLQLEKMYITAN
ncbi:MAG TPA: TolC family protein [Lentimicrobium sp.]|nr:TolC family protein [Lentimicrobium sp.]